jgi:hypothetical protein
MVALAGVTRSLAERRLQSASHAGARDAVLTQQWRMLIGEVMNAPLIPLPHALRFGGEGD